MLLSRSYVVTYIEIRYSFRFYSSFVAIVVGDKQLVCKLGCNIKCPYELH